MLNKIQTIVMAIGDVDEAIALWKNQLLHFPSGKLIYSQWNNTFDIEEALKKVIQSGRAFKAVKNGEIVGFITFDIFNFHGSMSAICHFYGTAVSIDNRKNIYFILYNELCKYCMNENVLTHYISTLADDSEVIEMFFDLGFGSYVIDAYAKIDKVLEYRSEFTIALASNNEAPAILNLYNESIEYFDSSPIGLKLDSCSSEHIHEKINSNSIYIAKNAAQIVGMFEIEVADRNNIYRMYPKGCCVVCGELGTYIKEAYRGKGIGRSFIKSVSEYCVNNNISYAHVPWETFNPQANSFWRKFFTPTILSMKRVIHPDNAK